MSALSLSRIYARHRGIATALTGIAIGLALAFPAPPLVSQLVLVAVGVALFGVPHGALDDVVARSLRRTSWIRFAASYLAWTLAAVAFWWLSPAFALVAFLAISAVHFGEGDRFARPAGVRPAWLEIAVRGSLPVVLPAAFFTDQVAIAFDALLPAHASLRGEDIAGAAAVAGWLTFAALPLIAVLARTDARPGLLTELTALALLFAMLPPLLAFAVYFCLWHSARHSIWLATVLDGRGLARGLTTYLRRAIPLTVVTLAGMAIVWRVIAEDLDAGQAALRVLFVSLFALTVPHVRIVQRGYRVAHQSTVGSSDVPQ